MKTNQELSKLRIEREINIRQLQDEKESLLTQQVALTEQLYESYNFEITFKNVSSYYNISILPFVVFLCFLNLNSESQSYKMKKSPSSLGKLYHYSFLRNGKQICLKMWSGNQHEHFHNYYYGSILINKTIVDYIFHLYNTCP